MGVMADIDEMMYACGVEILHPGGLEKTDEMARLCQIGASKTVLDIRAGRGASACYLARKYGCSVVGIDTSRRMIDMCTERARREGLSDRVAFEVADAYALPFGNDSFDIVIAECVTTLLDKPKVFTEMVRVLKPGGYLGDLEMTWRSEPPPQAVVETQAVWGGYQTFTLPQWSELLEQAGLGKVQVVDFSETLADMEKATRRDLGWRGELRLAARLAFRSDLRRGMYAYWKLFRTYSEYIGYGYFVGQKPGDVLVN
jgi:SAM-dependent methyltransferase